MLEFRKKGIVGLFKAHRGHRPFRGTQEGLIAQSKNMRADLREPSSVKKWSLCLVAGIGGQERPPDKRDREIQTADQVEAPADSFTGGNGAAVHLKCPQGKAALLLPCFRLNGKSAPYLQQSYPLAFYGLTWFGEKEIERRKKFVFHELDYRPAFSADINQARKPRNGIPEHVASPRFHPNAPKGCRTRKRWMAPPFLGKREQGIGTQAQRRAHPAKGARIENPRFQLA